MSSIPGEMDSSTPLMTRTVGPEPADSRSLSTLNRNKGFGLLLASAALVSTGVVFKLVANHPITGADLSAGALRFRRDP